MRSLLLCITLLLAFGLDQVSADSCKSDNCLQAARGSPSLASSFCTGYLKTTQTATTGIPTFLSDCKNKPSKISSACSCILSSTSSATLTTTSTSIRSSSSTSSKTSSKLSSSTSTSTTTSTSIRSSSTSSGSSSKLSSSTSTSTTTSNSIRSSSSSSTSSGSSSTSSKASTMLTCSSCPTFSASGIVGTTTTTITATTTVATLSTCSASSVTVTVSATTPSGGSIDMNGCPNIAGSNNGDYVFECGVNFGDGSIEIGTNPGYNVEDCESQCFLNILGGDCLGVTYTPGSPPYDMFGALRVGTCTLYSFPDGRVSAPGMAVAAFAGF